jgi:GcrA cell cycle regulator
MRWTVEAIENLIKLALEGRSASFIAAALGAASRNAVIGKANRIGVKLNGDGRASLAHGTSARAYRVPLAALLRSTPVSGRETFAPAVSRNPRVVPGSKPGDGSQPGDGSKPGDGSQPGDGDARKTAWTFAEAEVGEMRRVRFEDIREFACRWPLGDPRSGDFAYCGLKPAEGRPYCAGHCRMAYRGAKARARQSPRERSWSRALASPWR